METTRELVERVLGEMGLTPNPEKIRETDDGSIEVDLSQSEAHEMEHKILAEEDVSCFLSEEGVGGSTLVVFPI